VLTHTSAPTLTGVSAQPTPNPVSAWAPDPQRQRLGTYTVEDVIGLPDDAPRVELRDGVMIPVPAPTAGHQLIMGRLWQELSVAAPARYTVLMAVGVVVTQTNTFEPDVVVLDGPVERSLHYFRPEQCVLAVEIVSPSTKRRDRLEKPCQYAAAGVPYYWRVEQDPTGIYVSRLVNGQYEMLTEATSDDPVLRLDEPFSIAVSVDSL
jgi:Uma2 family endonuclease